MKVHFSDITISTFLSIASLVILFGYISYKEGVKQSASVKVSRFSDEGVIRTSFTEPIGPMAAISYDVPTEISFADEKVPLHIRDVRERLDKELQINSYFHSNTIFLIKRANRWLPSIQEVLRKNGIPDDFKYLPLIESNLLNAVSPKEAVGFWQILDSAGKEYGLEISGDVDERYDPLKSTEAACKYLKQAYQKFGDWALVAASYNRGISGIQRALENQQVNSYYDLYLNDETSRYVFRILAIKEIIQNPARYGFKVNPAHLYEEEPLRYVEVDDNIRDLIAFAKKHGTNYKLLKRHNPWLRDDKLTVKKGKTYRIAIPKE